MLQGIQTAGSLLINTKEAAFMLGISDHNIRRMIFLKKIPHVQLGRLIKLRRRDIEALIESNGIKETENVNGTNQEAKTG